MPKRIVRRALALGIVLLNACHVWSPAALDPAHDFLNGRARLHRTDGSVVIMRGPRLAGDSIIGTWDANSARTTVPRADVQRVEVYRISRGRTALAGLGIVAAYIALNLALIASATPYPE